MELRRVVHPESDLPAGLALPSGKPTSANSDPDVGVRDKSVGVGLLLGFRKNSKTNPATVTSLNSMVVHHHGLPWFDDCASSHEQLRSRIRSSLFVPLDLGTSNMGSSVCR